jgi:hypothetical protein
VRARGCLLALCIALGALLGCSHKSSVSPRAPADLRLVSWTTQWGSIPGDSTDYIGKVENFGGSTAFRVRVFMYTAPGVSRAYATEPPDISPRSSATLDVRVWGYLPDPDPDSIRWDTYPLPYRAAQQCRGWDSNPHGVAPSGF